MAGDQRRRASFGTAAAGERPTADDDDTVYPTFYTRYTPDPELDENPTDPQWPAKQNRARRMREWIAVQEQRNIEMRERSTTAYFGNLQGYIDAHRQESDADTQRKKRECLRTCEADDLLKRRDDAKRNEAVARKNQVVQTTMFYMVEYFGRARKARSGNRANGGVEKSKTMFPPNFPSLLPVLDKNFKHVYSSVPVRHATCRVINRPCADQMVVSRDPLVREMHEILGRVDARKDHDEALRWQQYKEKRERAIGAFEEMQDVVDDLGWYKRAEAKARLRRRANEELRTVLDRQVEEKRESERAEREERQTDERHSLERHRLGALEDEQVW